MCLELTPKEIAEVRRLLAERRNDVDVDKVQVEKRESMPSETGNCVLQRLGSIGGWSVWAMGIGWLVLEVILVPPSIEDSVDWYIARSKPVVESVEMLFDDLRNDSERPQEDVDHVPGYIAYNPEWRNLPDDQLEIRTAPENFNINQDNMMIAASTTASHDIIAGSGYIPGGSSTSNSGFFG